MFVIRGSDDASGGHQREGTYDDGFFTDRHGDGCLSRQVVNEGTCKGTLRASEVNEDRNLSRGRGGI